MKIEALTGQLAAPLTEPMPVPDVFCSGMAAIEHIGGGCVRLHLYVNQTGIVGQAERVVVMRAVMPLEALTAAHKLVHQALDLPLKDLPLRFVS
jgi:hypothetical protein